MAVPPTSGDVASKPDSDFVEEGLTLAKSRENVKFIKVDESWQGEEHVVQALLLLYYVTCLVSTLVSTYSWLVHTPG